MSGSHTPNENQHYEDEINLQMSSMPFQKKHKEDSEGVWLISYSDMMTLLMGFFALMLSMGKIDLQKAEELKKNAAKTFGGEYKEQFDQLYQELRDLIAEKGLTDQIQLVLDSSGLSIVFKGTTFFDSGSTTLKPEAEELMGQIAPLLMQKAKGYQILFEGHTDNNPIHNPHIPSNWDLSGLRASSVARLVQSRGLPAKDMIIIGWGDTRPEKPNTDSAGNTIPENQTANRRVIVKILRQPLM